MFVVVNDNVTVMSVRDAPPVVPTTAQHGYKQMKAKIGQSRVRPWKWMPFTNPARKVCYFIIISINYCLLLILVYDWMNLTVIYM